MPNTSLIKDTIDHLTDVHDLLERLGPIEDAIAKATDTHENLKDELTSIRKELTDARSGLTVAQLKNIRDYEDAIFEKAQQAKKLDAKIGDLQTKHDTKVVEVQAISDQHKQLEDSLASLRKQHFG